MSRQIDTLHGCHGLPDSDRTRRMKILVVGKGGREHALVTALDESASKPELFAFPGSDAIHQMAAKVDATDLPSLMAFMKGTEIDLRPCCEFHFVLDSWPWPVNWCCGHKRAQAPERPPVRLCAIR